MTQDFLNSRDRFARANGVQIIAMRPGWARCEMVVTEQHLNGANVCQGGALFTLADLAMAAVVNGTDTDLLPEQGVGLSVHTEIDYRRPALLNECIAAECRFIEDGRKPRLQVVITNPNGECVAEVTGLFVRTKKQLP